MGLLESTIFLDVFLRRVHAIVSVDVLSNEFLERPNYQHEAVDSETYEAYSQM